MPDTLRLSDRSVLHCDIPAILVGGLTSRDEEMTEAESLELVEIAVANALMLSLQTLDIFGFELDTEPAP